METEQCYHDDHSYGYDGTDSCSSTAPVYGAEEFENAEYLLVSDYPLCCVWDPYGGVYTRQLF
ncbi:hypothetical protein D3C76_1704580 [compost metagenome]